MLLFIVLTIIALSCKNKEFKTEPATQKTSQITEWESLNYGMFIHFSMNTFTGFEYDEGQNPTTTYEPVDLDVKQWVRTAKQAGMEYAVLTVKHMSGFCLWDSKVMWKGKEYDYDVEGSNYKTDVVAEFITACKEEGIKPGLYYCILDPHNEGKIDWESRVTDEYFDLVKGQIEELHTLYNGISEQWIDIPSKLSTEQRFELYGLINRLSPGCLITCNNGFSDGVKVQNWPVDLVNGERTLPPASGHDPYKKINGVDYYIPMEVCQTISQNWFWMPNDPPKSVQTLNYWYQQCQERGANFLLNVPPDRNGRIPDEFVSRLKELNEVIDNPNLLPLPKSLTYRNEITVSSTWHNRPEYRPDYALDEDLTTRWIASEGLSEAWMEVDLKEERKFNQLKIVEPYGSYIKELEFQYKYGDIWKTFFNEDDFNGNLLQDFDLVSARYVRIIIKRYTDKANRHNVVSKPKSDTPIEGPSISEFQLFLRV